MLNIKEGITFDDVLIVPKFSNIGTRKSIDLSVKLSKGLGFKYPLIPANMATITGIKMAVEIFKSGGMAILHRFMPWGEQIKALSIVLDIDEAINHIGFSVGAKEEDYKCVDYFAERGATILCIDIAHGDSEHCIKMTKYIAEKYPNIFLIAGNVATGEGAKRLWEAGADCVKVGVGGGSLCSTRIETGNGVPQLTALADVAEMKKTLTSPSKIYTGHSFNGNPAPYRDGPPAITKPIFIISDGGIRSAGDCVKALCFADMIMTGNLFAGSEETPGEIMLIDGKRYKNYVGSSTHKTNHVEGVAALTEPKGSARNIITKLCEGIASGCSYQGVSNLINLKKDPQFVRMTSAGLKESHPHDVLVVK